ncbi:hypothetical protein GQ42DRAFT_166035 [Ramicandelaber brevisporus]|nr:hypothetical protein GQ42DRAFT_166035 [Ramicandelaber brevisporus]
MKVSLALPLVALSSLLAAVAGDPSPSAMMRAGGSQVALGSLGSSSSLASNINAETARRCKDQYRECMRNIDKLKKMYGQAYSCDHVYRECLRKALGQKSKDKLE